MTDFALTVSVGSGGENRERDVRALQQRFVDLGYDWLAVDGISGPNLQRVINLVQSIKAGRNTLSGDGRVDVPGPTYGWLRASNAPRWQLVPEGSREAGFVNAERADPDDNHDYGTDWMADTIESTGVRYRDNYLSDDPDAAPLTVNDVSVPRGGDTPDHSTHETGMACDVRLPRTDGSAGGITYHRDSYDRDDMRATLEAIRHQPRVSRILFNDDVLVGENLCESAAGHDDHAHFEIQPLLEIRDYPTDVDELARQAVRHFDGTVVEPTDYPMTRTGFQSYLDDTGVEFFSAEGMVEPHQSSVARSLGYAQLLPPHAWWPRGGALALLADELRALVGERVEMRNWWRRRATTPRSTAATRATTSPPTAWTWTTCRRTVDLPHSVAFESCTNPSPGCSPRSAWATGRPTWGCCRRNSVATGTTTRYGSVDGPPPAGSPDRPRPVSGRRAAPICPPALE